MTTFCAFKNYFHTLILAEGENLWESFLEEKGYLDSTQSS